jgi:hypothetical protein
LSECARKKIIESNKRRAKVSRATREGQKFERREKAEKGKNTKDHSTADSIDSIMCDTREHHRALTEK